MTSPEFNEAEHDQNIEEGYRRIARLALFEELMSFVDTGDCTREQAIAQYQHDAAEGGLL